MSTQAGEQTHLGVDNEQITMMTLWSIMRSPLMIGGEMTGFDDFTMKLITNEAVMKMHASSRNAKQVFRRVIAGSEYILWTADDCDGGKYLAVFNAGEQRGTLSVALDELEDLIPGSKATELWSGESVVVDKLFSVEIPEHGANVFYIEK